jgi:hypothetical protein
MHRRLLPNRANARFLLMVGIMLLAQVGVYGGMWAAGVSLELTLAISLILLSGSVAIKTALLERRVMWTAAVALACAAIAAAVPGSPSSWSAWPTPPTSSPEPAVVGRTPELISGLPRLPVEADLATHGALEQPHHVLERAAQKGRAAVAAVDHHAVLEAAVGELLAVADDLGAVELLALDLLHRCGAYTAAHLKARRPATDVLPR